MSDEQSAKLQVSDLSGAQEVVDRLRTRLRAGVVGRDDISDLVLVALLSDGHVLLEDFPGSGKTTLAKTLGACLIDDAPHDGIVSLRRIQFTPDLLPGDVTGTTIFDANRGTFEFRPGPIFAHVVLADEINRTSPKVQSALLEAMAEKQVTVDNVTHGLDDLFLVLATQNPLDLAGTFPLPSAQLDRFLFKIRMTHISAEAEFDLLERIDQIKKGPPKDLLKVTRTQVLDTRGVIHRGVAIDAAIKRAMVAFAESTRNDDRILQGVSSRSLVLLLPALQVRAMMEGRDHVVPDDLLFLAPHAFGHRLAMAPGGGDALKVTRELMGRVVDDMSRKSWSR